MIRPFICTCDKRIKTFRRFINSYNANVKSSLLPPIVYYDGEGEYYHELIGSIEPVLKIRQKDFDPEIFGTHSDTIDYKAVWEFPRIIRESFSHETILFLEDDVLFSSKFSKIIGKVEKQMLNNSAVNVVTLFGSGECYWPKVNNKASDLIYRFDGAEYYGNLAVAFSPKTMSWWYENREKVWDNRYFGWDIKIGNVFQQAGMSFYCTDKHYVQHQIGYSVIAQRGKEQQSSMFEP